jgi:hypothetical protein
MANANTPFGFKPVKMHGSSPMSGGLETFYVPSTDGTALFMGDPVIKAGSADANGVATVTRSTAAGAISGIVVGFLPDPVTGVVPHYRAASTAAYVLCCTDPAQVYEVQEDAVGGALAAVDVGLNADFIIAAGSTYTGNSGTMLDTSTKATTAGLPLKILGFVQRPDNVIGALAKVLVKINLSTEIAGSAGV